MELIFTLQQIDKGRKRIYFINNQLQKLLLLMEKWVQVKPLLFMPYAKQMGVTDKMSSPTYAIINQYKTINGNNKSY